MYFRPIIVNFLLGFTSFESQATEHTAFKRIKSDTINYINVATQQFIHPKTGAEILLLEPSEATTERLFMVAFRTPPEDDTGVPHILEHSVLSGSQKYPLKNPFFNMAETSAATFLNAMTDSDVTIYPVVTIDSRDLLNLASVYLDGIFAPLCIHDRMIYEREGWHLEYDETNKTLQYSGVVYNEMKGYYSNPSMIAFRRIATELFRDTIYAYSSGGDPRAIVDLQYEDYVDYYYHHYHPSNARIMYYGAMDRIDELLDMVDGYLTMAADRYVEKYGPITESLAEKTRIPAFPIQPNADIIFAKQEVPSTSEKELKDSVLFVAAVADDSLTLCEKMSLKFLSSLLMGTKDSPLFKSLLKAEYADQISPSEIFQWGRTTLFLMESSGINPDWTCDYEECKKAFNADRFNEYGHSHFFHDLIEMSLAQIAEEGFDPSDVNGKLNRFEFILKEAAVNQEDQAFYLSQTIISRWTYDHDPLEYSQIDEGFSCLRSNIRSDPNYLQNILKKYLLNNKHRIVLTLEETPTYSAQMDKLETERLSDLLVKLNNDQLLEIQNRSEALKAAQRKPDTPELLNLLPKLKLSSLPRKALPLEYNLTTIEGVPAVYLNSQMANILYTTLLIDLPNLSFEDLHYIDLLLFILMNGDTSDYSAMQLNSLKEAHMGRLSLNVETSSSHAPMKVRDSERASLWLTVTFDCLRNQLEKCVQIVSDIFLRNGLEKNKQRSAIYLKENVVDLEDTLSAQPATYVASKLMSKLSALGALNDFISGLPSLDRTKALLNEVTNDWDGVVTKMNKVLGQLFDPKRMAIRLLGDENSLAEGMNLLGPLVANLSSMTPPESHTNQISFSVQNGFEYYRPRWLGPDGIAFTPPSKGFSTIYETSTMVSSNILAGVMYPGGALKPYQQIIPARVLSSSFILPQLRLEGGAYGASFSLNEESGLVVFQSSRDPHVFRSFDIMLKSGTEVYQVMETVTDQRIEELIIQSIFKLDRPRKQVTKANLAFKRWASGWTNAYEQRKRDLIFNVSRQDFYDFADRLNSTLANGLLFAVSAANPRSLDKWPAPSGGALEPFDITSLRKDIRLEGEEEDTDIEDFADI